MERETSALIDARVQEIFRNVFDSEDIQIKREMTAQDVEGWDSLANIQMIVAVEKCFKIKFTTTEIVQLENVGDLIDLIQARLGK